MPTLSDPTEDTGRGRRTERLSWTWGTMPTMDDVMPASAARTDLEHEPPVPGWPPRPPDVILRRSRLERHRQRQLERLEQTRPRWHRRTLALQRASRRFWEAVLPRERVLRVTAVVLALTVFDGVATIVLVGGGVAEEGNPLMADLIVRIGLAPAMGVRVVVGSVLTLVLAWLSTWRREVRPVLALVAVVLCLVAGLHVLGLVWRLS